MSSLRYHILLFCILFLFLFRTTVSYDTQRLSLEFLSLSNKWNRFSIIWCWHFVFHWRCWLFHTNAYRYRVTMMMTYFICYNAEKIIRSNEKLSITWNQSMALCIRWHLLIELMMHVIGYNLEFFIQPFLFLLCIPLYLTLWSYLWIYFFIFSPFNNSMSLFDQ